MYELLEALVTAVELFVAAGVVVVALACVVRAVQLRRVRPRPTRVGWRP